MNSSKTPPIVRAAQSGSIYEAAQAYARLEMSIIPLKGKRPALNGLEGISTAKSQQLC